MKDLVTIGLPSKGRLKESSLNFLEKNNLKLSSKGGDRDYFADFDNLANAKVIYLHAKEIIERLGDGTLDAGISGLKDEAVGEMTMDELEKEVIEKYLIKFKNNRRQTANALNISERTLYRKLKEYEIK